ncbi:2OG-Fe(II) oxygenase [Cyclobacterium qasimii]|uniref:Oxidoreductase n=2 Tax=Cyclobacterium qasimii TaxID=1350429 RepID=S7VH04_9BACT|nr:2OG-Fe(II) oxygenase [Cyclobacterium qasimii]EPR69266.1 oxidoreductase [Cyclobacterium qasimii M12-11B]GEO20953.1 2OG-Fe(II) oxygenase [Cyclobacterium qasimii]
MDDLEKSNDKVVQDLYDKGWSVVDNYISEDFRTDMLREQKELLMHGQFRLAGIGSGETFAIKPEIRSDKVLWMDENLLTPIQEVYWDKMDRLKSAINRRCFLGLKSYEAHFAMYPQGSFYSRHLDQFQTVQYRIVSVILYLNDTWEESDGGELRMYFTRPDGIEEYQDFLPVGGRLVVFLSGEIPHEVLPTAKERISITGWMKDRN